MSKENLEQFMKQVAESKELQAKIGKEITGDALVSLGAAHGCEFSIEDVQASEGESILKVPWGLARMRRHASKLIPLREVVPPRRPTAILIPTSVIII